jgi:DMSO/TMAO reductase YedYZ molybdopterin-dependent catalytic subunit
MKNRLGMALSGWILAGLLTACAQATPAPADLGTAEIRDYQGVNLSSVNDFPENSIAGVQNVDLQAYRLKISGMVDRPQELTYAQVTGGARYQKVVTLYCVEGWDATILWEGVRIADLLDAAGAQPGAVTVIFHAVDGYTSSLPLEFIRGNNILLADKMNGVTLPPPRGYPFTVVAESKWGYKWARWVNEIELSADPNYQGYWESRGYNNNGDQSGPKFELGN